MENQTLIARNAAPVKAAVICLAVAWIFALLPIPFISMMGMIVMNIAALILAIICMSKSAVKPGVGVLAGSLIGTPIMYFLGLAVLGAGMGSAITGHSKHAAQASQPKQLAPAKNKETAKAPAKAKEAASTATIASELAGKWTGEFVYPNGAKASFNMTLANPSGSLINGDMAEADPNTKQSVSSVISGNVANNEVSFRQIYSGQQDAVCTGKYSDSTKQISGQCSVGNFRANFVAKKVTSWL